MPPSALTEAEKAELDAKFDSDDQLDAAVVVEARTEAGEFDDNAGDADVALMDEGEELEADAGADDDPTDVRPSWSSRSTAPPPAIGPGTGTSVERPSVHAWAAHATVSRTLASMLNALWPTDFFARSLFGVLAATYIAVVLLEAGVVRRILQAYTFSVLSQRGVAEGVAWFEDRARLAKLITLCAALKQDQSGRTLPSLIGGGGATTLDHLIDMIVLANPILADYRDRLHVLQDDTLKATINDLWAADVAHGVVVNMVERRHIRVGLSIELLEAVDGLADLPPLTPFPSFDEHWLPFSNEYAASCVHRLDLR